MSRNTSTGHPLSRAHYAGAGVAVVVFASWAAGARPAAAADQGTPAVAPTTYDEAAPTVRGVWLGFTVQPLTPDIARSLGLSGKRGALVSDVDRNGPAARVGLKPSDIIVAIDQHPVANEVEALNRIATSSAGTTVALDVLHRGVRETLSPRVAELPKQAELAASPIPAASPVARWGIVVEPLTSAMAEVFAMPPASKGVVVTAVDPHGVAAASGLETIDVIEQVNGRPVGNAAELCAALEDAAGKPALLFIDRDGLTRFITVRVDEP